MAKVNICMAVRDRQELTEQCLQSLHLSLMKSEHDSNLTIVDDGSSARTRDFLLCRSATAPFMNYTHIIRSHRPLGVGGAKSLCAYASEIRWGRGDFLYFTDNDMYFEEGWLEKMVTAAKVLNTETTGHKPVCVVGGYNNPYQGPIQESFRCWLDGEYVNCRYFDALGGASMMMTWDTWDQFGPFAYNARGVRQSEDVDFGNRVRRAGGKLAALWPHVVHDCGRTDTFGQKVPYADVMPEVEGAKVI